MEIIRKGDYIMVRMNGNNYTLPYNVALKVSIYKGFKILRYKNNNLHYAVLRKNKFMADFYSMK